MKFRFFYEDHLYFTDAESFALGMDMDKKGRFVVAHRH